MGKSKRVGRPTKYNPRLAALIIKRIMSGEAVCSIVKDEAMPANSTLYKWLSKDQKFAERYAQALEFRTHLKAEQRHEVIESAIKELRMGDMPEGFNFNVWGNLVKEKIRAIEWDAERLAPVKYRVNHKQEIDGDDVELKPIPVRVVDAS